MPNINRRKFLQSSFFTTAVLPFLSNGATAEKQKNATILNYNKEMFYRRLGKTDIHLSVISLGGIEFEEPVARYAIDKGVNFIHMSRTYRNGASIKKLGRILKTERSKVYIALKTAFDDIDDVLKEMNTDYIDFLMFDRHKADEMNIDKDFEQFEIYKKAGKVLYCGMTTHNDIKACVAKAIDGGRYTLIMPVLNQPSLEALDSELKRAYEKKIGIMAMKTMKGITDEALETAYLKKILNNPAVTTVNKGITSFQKFDTYMQALGEVFSLKEDSALYRYAQQNRANNCMMCAACEKICPNHVAISTILRCKTYYLDQHHDTQYAAEVFRTVRDQASCSYCGICETNCPNGIAISKKLKEAIPILREMV